MKRARYKILLISVIMIFIISFGKEAYSQPRLEWVSNYISDTTQFHYAIDMAIDSSGNTYVLGDESNYAILIKINPEGSIVWKRQHQTQGQNFVKNVFIDNSGNINMFFYSGNLYFIKYNQNGDSILGKKLNVVFDSFTATNLKINKNGDIFVGGSYVNIASVKDFIILKLDKNFNIIWEYRESIPTSILNISQIHDINFDSKGNVYYCGYDGIFSSGDTSHLYLKKINSSGIFEWRKDYAPPHTQTNGNFLLIDSNDFIYVSGSLYFIPEQGARFLILKYDINGNLIWNKYFPDSHVSGTDFTPRDAKLDKNENIIIGGDYSSTSTISNDYKVFKYSNNGELLWDKLFNINFTAEYFKSLDIDILNNIYITGHQSTDIDTRVHTIKTSPLGHTVWVINYISPSFKMRGRALGNKIIVDKYFNVYISGDGNVVDYSTEIFCLKYNQLTQIFSQIDNIRNYQLFQNYPNPFNPETNIEIKINISGEYELKIFDISGKLIEITLSKQLHSGNYIISWNADKYPSGIYFYSLYKDGEKLDMKKMILIK